MINPNNAAIQKEQRYIYWFGVKWRKQNGKKSTVFKDVVCVEKMGGKNTCIYIHLYRSSLKVYTRNC